MRRSGLDDLVAFSAVASERSFTRAAARLGVSPSALSQSMRGLEERLGVRLLARSTRSVATTEAGERLLRNIGPNLEAIQLELASISALRDKPAGTIRISATEYAIDMVLLPKLARFLPAYPEINVEVVVDYGLTDIVAERFDAGIRSGEQVAKDMIAVPIGPDQRMAVVGSPNYFLVRSRPKTPMNLASHNCINLRLPTYGGIYAWEFEKRDRQLRVRVEGQITCNNAVPILAAALAGLGLAYLPEDVVKVHIERGDLVRVLGDWCPPFSGLHIHYPSRRQQSPAFSLLLDALRYIKN